MGGLGSHVMADTLVILRTAFQGWFARRLIEDLGVLDYDVLQISHDNAPEERAQFDLIAAHARKAWFVEGRRLRFDFLTQLDLWRRIPHGARTNPYRTLMLASIDAPVIGAIAARHPAARLVTWDDGLANVMPRGRYHTEALSWRAHAVRGLLRAGPIAGLKQRIAEHHTMFPGQTNIVADDKVRPVSTSVTMLQSADRRPGPRYFIGQPFEEALTPAGIAWLKEQVEASAPEWYVRHPRERYPLIEGVPELEKCGQIAEEAVARHADGRAIQLVGAFSTTLFSLGELSTDVSMFLPRDLKDRDLVAMMGQKSGFCIIRE